MKAVIVGAGIVGSNIAYRLARSGAEVVIVESGTPGAAASATSYAWLNSNNVENPRYYALRVLGMSAYRDLAKELGDSDWLHETGNVHVAFTDAAAEKLRAKVARKRAQGYPAEVLPRGGISLVEPALRDVAARAMAVASYPDEGYLDTTSLIGDLLFAFRELGGVMVRARAQELLRDADGRVTGVRTDAGTEITADQVVLCAGASSDLLEGAGVPLPLRGDVGASVITTPLPLKLAGLIHFPDLSVRPDGNGRIVIRAKDIDERVDTANMTLATEAVAELVRRARELLPLDGVDFEIEEVRIAFRPRPPDGLPVVGPVPGLEGAYLVSCHSGVTLGAVLGRLVGLEVLDRETQPLLEPFRADRVLTRTTDDYEAESSPAT
jgi:glycine/D-amino acid oxidase-like deaminating enzyme